MHRARVFAAGYGGASSHFKQEQQQDLWVPTAAMPTAPGPPFYRRLNDLLREHGFDAFAEDLCQKFYHQQLGRPGIPPGVYFRMLLIDTHSRDHRPRFAALWPVLHHLWPDHFRQKACRNCLAGVA